jgi:hypothetical protein
MAMGTGPVLSAKESCGHTVVNTQPVLQRLLLHNHEEMQEHDLMLARGCKFWYLEKYLAVWIVVQVEYQ